MKDSSKQTNKKGQAQEKLHEGIPVDKQKTKEYMKKVKQHIATAVENDEPSNEQMQKEDVLRSLEYTDGKQRDEIDQIEDKEKLMGVDVISPFGTGNPRVFKRKLESMSHVKKTKLAERTGTRIFADEEAQDSALITAFNQWRGGNWSSTGSQTEAKIGVLAADSMKEFEVKIKNKTLSELQEMAMKLGFTPSFDRIRLISALKQEYLKRG
jgi:hypothetical protein